MTRILRAEVFWDEVSQAEMVLGRDDPESQCGTFGPFSPINSISYR